MRYLRILLCVTLVAAGTASGDEIGPGKWPPGWIAAYERFERFLALRRQLWPTATLEISEGHRLTWELTPPAGAGEFYSLVMFQGGAAVARLSLDSSEVDIEKVVAFSSTPGRLAFGVRAHLEIGGGHLPKLAWFKVSPVDPPPPYRLRIERRFLLKPIPAPAPEEDFWPSERLLAWLDYHAMPSRGDLRSVNSKIQPAIALQIDHSGVIRRELLPDAGSEASLRWRVYRNGVLVDGGAAGGITALPTARWGPGYYVALVGIVGPNGFLPVSNLLKYGLAPKSSGGLELYLPVASWGSGNPMPWWGEALFASPNGSRGGPFFSDEAAMSDAQALWFALKSGREIAAEPDEPWIVPATTKERGR